MPPIKTYYIKSYDGSEVLYSYTGAVMPNVLEKGLSFNDNSVYTYGGNKTFVGVSSIPNARRCEYGIGSASCSFSDDNSLYIYESEDTELPFLMNYTTDRD